MFPFKMVNSNPEFKFEISKDGYNQYWIIEIDSQGFHNPMIMFKKDRESLESAKACIERVMNHRNKKKRVLVATVTYK